MELELIEFDNSQPVLLVPIADTQVGSAGFSEASFKRWLNRQLELAHKLDYKIMYIGLGDYGDFLRPSIRRRVREIEDDNVFDMLYEKMERQVERIERLFEPTKGKWLGMLEGHHYMELTDSNGNTVTSDTLLAQRLGAKFMGDSCIIRMSMNTGHGSSRVAFTIWAHHGEGSGVSSTSAITRLEKEAMRETDVDLFLMGHQHKAATAKIPGIRTIVRGGKLIRKDFPRSLVSVGGWLQGWQQGSRAAGRPQGLYPEQRMLPPLAIGGTCIFIYPVREGSGDRAEYMSHEVVV